MFVDRCNLTIGARAQDDYSKGRAQAGYRLVASELQKRGWSVGRLERLIGGNFLRDAPGRITVD